MALFEASTNPQMQSHAVSDRHARVKRIPIQRVDERIAARHRPIRPLHRAGRAEELSAPRKLRAASLAFARVDPVGGGQRGRELDARHARHGEHRLLGRRQAVELLFDELPERRYRQPASSTGTGASRSVDFPHAALREQMVDDIHGKSGLPFVFMKHARESHAETPGR
jgi:hypothetical protein